MAATYRFGDSAPTGVVLGLRLRQVVPLVVAVLAVPVVVQLRLPAPWPALLVVFWLTAGVVVAFGRWRGAPLAEIAVPATRLRFGRMTGRGRWVRHSLVGDDNPAAPARLPRPLAGLDLVEVPFDGRVGMAVIRDRPAGTVSAVVRVHGSGFGLASADEQDVRVGAWGAALGQTARERCPVRRITWQEWAHPVGIGEHLGYVDGLGIRDRTDTTAVDYQQLLAQQGAATVRHETLVTVTVDQRLVRRRSSVSGLDAAIEALTDEVRLLSSRLEAAQLRVSAPLSPGELAGAIRLRSDPSRSAQVTKLQRSLAAAAQVGAINWGPLAVDDTVWGHTPVDGSVHRSYWVAGWPSLPVPADWLAALLTCDDVTRTVTVVLEPVPASRAARAADRQVLAMEADHDLKSRKGFRINAAERKRLANVEARERELSEGHAQFRFVGIVTVTAADAERLDDAAATVEQAAAQSLLDLRALEARHALGWVASLPMGRSLASRSAR